MSMKNILVAVLWACLAACNVKDGENPCPYDPSAELIEVVVHEYNPFPMFREVDWIVATLPDGSRSREILRPMSGGGIPDLAAWPSTGSDGATLMFVSGQGLFGYSIESGRVTTLIRRTNDIDISYFYSQPDFSYDMREINGSYAGMVFSVLLSNGLANPIINTRSPVHSRQTADGHYVLVRLLDQWDGPLPETNQLVSTDRSGRNLKAIHQFEFMTEGAPVSLAAIPSFGSREFIYLSRSADQEEYRFVRTDVEGNYRITMDVIPASEGEITYFSASRNADRIAYFTQKQPVELGDPQPPVELVVRNYDNNRLTGVTSIPMPADMTLENWITGDFRRPWLGVIRRDIWERLPLL